MSALGGEADAEAAVVSSGKTHSARNGIENLLREDGATATISHAGIPIANFGDGPDPLYSQAVAIVREHSRPSISLVQRHLRIGYKRAARLLEQMETDEIVSTMQHDGTRTLLKP
ncbi:DNA translocase FtsK [Collimonas sp. NPDC087041]|uniref:DNA translocase FtsK n=1 Tax=Collimonas sp. NPDC087041 TaxID=3363960 RepID=UPI0038013B99